MYNPKRKPAKQYKISLKSQSGNTVAFVNFTEQFTKAVTGKSANTVTLEDVLNINDGKAIDFLRSLAVEIEAVLPDEVVDANSY